MILKTPHELRRSFFGFKKAKFSNIPLITTLPVSGRLRKTVHCYKETLIYDKLYINTVTHLAWSQRLSVMMSSYTTRSKLRQVIVSCFRFFNVKYHNLFTSHHSLCIRGSVFTFFSKCKNKTNPIGVDTSTRKGVGLSLLIPLLPGNNT